MSRRSIYLCTCSSICFILHRGPESSDGFSTKTSPECIAVCAALIPEISVDQQVQAIPGARCLQQAHGQDKRMTICQACKLMFFWLCKNNFYDTLAFQPQELRIKSLAKKMHKIKQGTPSLASMVITAPVKTTFQSDGVPLKWTLQ